MPRDMVNQDEEGQTSLRNRFIGDLNLEGVLHAATQSCEQGKNDIGIWLPEAERKRLRIVDSDPVGSLSNDDVFNCP